MARSVERPNRYFTFLRRLRADGRSNMYGAIPYLAAAFGLDRSESFRIVCEWVDAQEAAAAEPAAPKPRPSARERQPTLFDPAPAAAPPPAARRPVKQKARRASGSRAA